MASCISPITCVGATCVAACACPVSATCAAVVVAAGTLVGASGDSQVGSTVCTESIVGAIATPNP